VKKSARASLNELERLRTAFGPGLGATKRALIERVEDLRFERVADLLRWHEALCFVRAYPDDPETLALVERILQSFDRRSDLQALRDELWDSGLAGTDTWFPFFWATARWLCARWPDRLTIDWEAFENRDRVVELLPLLLPYTETPALDEIDRTAQQWIETLKGPDETDAAFLVRRVDALRIDEFAKEALYDALDVTMQLRGGPDTPSRTKGRWTGAEIHFQDRPLDRARPDLRAAAEVPPLAVTAVPIREGRALIDLARVSMTTRARDLDAFCNADPRDVRIVDCGDGLCFALMGATPERRLMLESSYGMLTLKNGLPIGYVLISAAFGSAAIAYNVFDTFRGGEAAKILGRVLAVARHVFGVDAFSIDPYQLGDGNEEGLRSGAWWFYQKLGFRPLEPRIDRLMRRELGRMKKDPEYRSELDTMRELVQDHVYLFLGEPRQDVLGRVSLGRIGLAVSRHLAARDGADREGGIRRCAAEAAALCGLGPDRSWSRGEKLWWERWAPVLLTVPGFARWTPASRRAAAEVVRLKGGRHESDFVRALERHAKLREGLLELAAEG
jgi:hypothetical protein